ncbi:MAG: hypothetical protein ABI113_14470 [Mucilaginibacter sp.]
MGIGLILKSKIKEGQVWSYNCRNSEQESRLTIIKLDKPGNEQIVHIRVDNVSIIQRNTGEVIATSIEHLPMSLDAFSKSVRKIESTVEIAINDGYFHWKKLFDKGEAGVWSVEVSDAIEITESTYNNVSF